MVLASLCLLVLASRQALAESCRFAGTTSHSGRVAVKADVSTAGDLLTVDVALTFTVSGWLTDAEYRGEEISTWRGGELQSVAVNARTVTAGRVRRQQWDVFVREPAGLAAYRVQAKTLAEFQRRHPGFARHWALSAFGQPWVQDYAAAGPERRPDLDLPAKELPRGLRSPLAMAFYWSRWLPPGGGLAPVFLPGFKHDLRSDLAVGPATPGDEGRRWLVRLVHPALAGSAPTVAEATVTPDGYLQRLAFDVHARLGSGQAVIGAQGCQGVQVRPTG